MDDKSMDRTRQDIDMERVKEDPDEDMNTEYITGNDIESPDTITGIITAIKSLVHQRDSHPYSASSIFNV